MLTLAESSNIIHIYNKFSLKRHQINNNKFTKLQITKLFKNFEAVLSASAITIFNFYP